MIKSRENVHEGFVVDRYKSKAGLRFGDMPNPELRDDDVMVQVCAAGVNPLDAKIRNGEFKLVLPYRLPLVLGNDVAGIVVRVGSKVRRFAGQGDTGKIPQGTKAGWQARIDLWSS